MTVVPKAASSVPCLLIMELSGCGWRLCCDVARPEGDSEDRAACRTNDTEPGQNAWISWCAGAGTDATIPSRLSMLPTRTEAGLSLPRCCAADKACTASRSKASEPTAYRVSVGKTIRRPERSASPAWESPCCLASGTRQFSGWSPSRAHRR